MKEKVKSIFQFTKNIFVTGAFAGSSKKVKVEVCRYLPSNKDITVIEFGMGQGTITKEILKNISAKSKLFSFEVNKEFCKHVKDKIQDDRLIIINDGAENLKKYIHEDVHCVIASIPFTFFSKEKGLGIIQDAHDVLVENAYYSQALFTKFNFKKFQMIFNKCELVKVPSLVKEYVYHCQKT